jgi:hypothetical protein
MRSVASAGVGIADRWAGNVHRVAVVTAVRIDCRNGNGRPSRSNYGAAIRMFPAGSAAGEREGDQQHYRFHVGPCARLRLDCILMQRNKANTVGSSVNWI